jgi:hypothetical protein
VGGAVAGRRLKAQLRMGDKKPPGAPGVFIVAAVHFGLIFTYVAPVLVKKY